jgi:hypothetical protein
LKNLKILSKQLGDDSLVKSTKHCALKSLTLASCPQLSCPNFSFDKLEDLSVIHCHQLQRPTNECVHLKNVNLTNSSGFDEIFIENLTNKNQDLKMLNLSKMNQLNSLNLKSKSLEYLNLNGSKNVSSLKLDCPILTFLDLSFTKITDQQLEEILFISKNLKVLRLKGCHELESPKIQHDHLAIIHLDHSKNLENLKLKCKKLNELGISFTNISDSSLTKILENCNALKTINIQKCSNLQYPRIYSDSLENLNFHGSSNILEPHIQSPKLKSLVLNWTHITDSTVRRIVNACPELNSLEMKICDELVSPLIESSSLEEIEFQGSRNLHSPVLSCTKLSRVGVSDCHSLDNNVRRKLTF